MVRIRSSAALLLAACLALPAQAFTVFACEPEWAALARELLPAATVHMATHAGQDPHHIEARPALIAQLRSAPGSRPAGCRCCSSAPAMPASRTAPPACSTPPTM